MRKLFVTISVFIFLFLFGFISKQQAYALGEFGSLNPNFNSTGVQAYTVGYRFQPKKDGKITQLWCTGNGGSSPSYVTLWDESNTSAPIAYTYISCTTSAWQSGNITPVNVYATHYYRVSQYGSGGWYTCATCYSPANINILSGVYFAGNGYPSTIDTSWLYGYPDVTYVPLGPTVSATSLYSYTNNSITLDAVVNPGSSSTIYIGIAYGQGSSYSGTACQNLPNKTAWGNYAPLTANSGNNLVNPTVYVNAGTLYYGCVYAYDSSTGLYYYSSNTVGVTSAYNTPIVSLYPPFLVEATSANLGAGVNAVGNSATYGNFRYGDQASGYNSSTPCSSLPSTTTNVYTGNSNGYYYPIAAKLNGNLIAGHTYWYCFQVTSPVSVYTATSSFTTVSSLSTGCQLFPGSVLATPANATTVAGYLGSSNFQGTKIYQGTVNGWTATNFQAAVDGQGPTITLIQNQINGKIFGGFNPLSWASTGGYQQGVGAFLFSLSDGYKLAQSIYADYMVVNGPGGPTFGGGYNLGIYSSPLNSATDYANPNGAGYENPSSKGYTYLNGGGGTPNADNFTPSEIEVYKISVCTAPPVTVTTTGNAGTTVNSITATGTVNPSSSSTVVYAAEYGAASAGYTSSTACSALPSTSGFSTPLAANSGNNSVSVNFSGLNSGSLYYFCIIAKDTGTGTVYYSPTTSSATTSYVLTVSVASTGSGGGTVSSNDGNIVNCSTTCTHTYTSVVSVTLTATPNGTSTFTGWSGGGCSGTGSCTVTTNTSQNVTANFAPITYTVTVNKGSTGGGTVTSNETPTPNINCGTMCSYNYGMSASVTLNAVPNPTSKFVSWTGVTCSEGQTTTRCTFTVNAPITVTANFSSIGYTGSITFYWGNDGQASCDPGAGASTRPALEVVVLSGSITAPATTKYILDGCTNNRISGSGLSAATSTVDTSFLNVTFNNSSTIPVVTNGLIMKVIPLFNSTMVGIQSSAGATFPAQGKIITSEGTAGDTKRKIIYYESYPQIPNEIFPYSILSQ